MRRQYWNTRLTLEDRQKVPCACRQGRIGVSRYTEVHTGRSNRWPHRREFRSVYLVKAATVAWQRFVLSDSLVLDALAASLVSWQWESPWVGRRFEYIRNNRGEKNKHWRRVSSILFSIFSIVFCLNTCYTFHSSLFAVCTRCPRRFTFFSNQKYWQSYRKESRLFRRSLSCERFGIRCSWTKYKMSQVKITFQCFQELEENFKLRIVRGLSECLNEFDVKTRDFGDILNNNFNCTLFSFMNMELCFSQRIMILIHVFGQIYDFIYE